MPWNSYLPGHATLHSSCTQSQCWGRLSFAGSHATTTTMEFLSNSAQQMKEHMLRVRVDVQCCWESNKQSLIQLPFRPRSWTRSIATITQASQQVQFAAEDDCVCVVRDILLCSSCCATTHCIPWEKLPHKKQGVLTGNKLWLTSNICIVNLRRTRILIYFVLWILCTCS